MARLGSVDESPKLSFWATNVKKLRLSNASTRALAASDALALSVAIAPGDAAKAASKSQHSEA
jgi:hypothetical protein